MRPVLPRGRVEHLHHSTECHCVHGALESHEARVQGGSGKDQIEEKFRTFQACFYIIMRTFTTFVAVNALGTLLTMTNRQVKLCKRDLLNFVL